LMHLNLSMINVLHGQVKLQCCECFNEIFETGSCVAFFG
jgi:hypothetical protein